MPIDCRCDAIHAPLPHWWKSRAGELLSKRSYVLRDIAIDTYIKLNTDTHNNKASIIEQSRPGPVSCSMIFIKTKRSRWRLETIAYTLGMIESIRHPKDRVLNGSSGNSASRPTRKLMGSRAELRSERTLWWLISKPTPGWPLEDKEKGRRKNTTI